MSHEKLLCFCIEDKLLCCVNPLQLILRETTAVVKKLFPFKDKLHHHGKSLLYILFLTRNYLVIKIFHILRLTVLGMHVFVWRSHCIVCSYIWRLRDSTWSLNGIFLLIYMFLLQRKKWPCCAKLFYMTLSSTLFIHNIE